MEFVIIFGAVLLLAALEIFCRRKAHQQSTLLQKRQRDLQLELHDAQTEIRMLKMLKNDIENIQNDVDWLKTQRETEDQKNEEERRREQEAERLFTEGVSNILGYGGSISGKRDE